MRTISIDDHTLDGALGRIDSDLQGTGWDERHVAEARQIIRLLDGSADSAGMAAVVRSRAEILRQDRYFEYWYFEGAPLSVQIALEAGLSSGVFVPDAGQQEKCAQFRAFFKDQLAFKRALIWSETVGGWLFPGEAENIWKMVRQHSGTRYGICEIGSWTGRSAILLGAARALHCPSKPLHVVDDWKFGGQPDLYPYLSEGRNLRLEFEENTRVYLEAPTIHEAKFQDFARTAAASPQKFDLVFHDAGHTAEDFERDLPLLETLLAPVSTLLIHDYVSQHFSDARRVIDAWIRANPARRLEQVLGCTAVVRIGGNG